MHEQGVYRAPLALYHRNEIGQKIAAAVKAGEDHLPLDFYFGAALPHGVHLKTFYDLHPRRGRIGDILQKIFLSRGHFKRDYPLNLVSYEYGVARQARESLAALGKAGGRHGCEKERHQQSSHFNPLFLKKAASPRT